MQRESPVDLGPGRIEHTGNVFLSKRAETEDPCRVDGTAYGRVTIDAACRKHFASARWSAMSIAETCTCAPAFSSSTHRAMRRPSADSAATSTPTFTLGQPSAADEDNFAGAVGDKPLRRSRARLHPTLRSPTVRAVGKDSGIGDRWRAPDKLGARRASPRCAILSSVVPSSTSRTANAAETSAVAVGSRSTRPPQISGCSTESVRPNPHSAAAVGVGTSSPTPSPAPLEVAQPDARPDHGRRCRHGEGAARFPPRRAAGHHRRWPPLQRDRCPGRVTTDG